MSSFKNAALHRLGFTESNISSLAKRENNKDGVTESIERNQRELSLLIKDGLSAQNITNILSGIGGEIEVGVGALVDNNGLLFEVVDSTRLSIDEVSTILTKSAIHVGSVIVALYEKREDLKEFLERGIFTPKQLSNLLSSCGKEVGIAISTITLKVSLLKTI